MALTRDIGIRIELVPMDLHCNEITVALYKQASSNGPAYRIHTYSQHPGAQQRIASLSTDMQMLGGMQMTDDGLLRFPCGHAHQYAVRRLFLDACKRDPSQPAQVFPLRIHDKKSACYIAVDCLGDGQYSVRAETETEGVERRTATIARGLVRLGEMEASDSNANCVNFACGHAHDALIALLLLRAPNVRAAMREAEEMASRGQLVAPSAQN